MSSIVSVSIVLDTQRELKNGEYPVKLRIIHERKNRYFALSSKKRISYSTEEFEKIQTSNRQKYKDERLMLSKYEEKAKEVVDSITPFSFDEFARKYRERKVNFKNIFEVFDTHIEELKKNGQVGTASTYTTALRSIESYYAGKVLPFHVITPGFLNDYQKTLLEEGKSITTVSINVRCIRKLYNMAIEAGEIGRNIYPFGKKAKGKYEVPKHRNVKKALDLSDVKKLYEYKPINEAESFNRDMWLFSYLCNGMNMTDIFRLKYKNINGDEVKFKRQKTSHGSQVQEIAAFITPDVKRIILKWGKSNPTPNDYIFPILKNGLKPEKELANVKQGTKQVNKYIQRIAGNVGIEVKVTTYTARHSYTTVLVKSGQSIEFIKEQLGHANSQTTQNYIGSFDTTSRKNAASYLTNWKEENE